MSITTLIFVEKKIRRFEVPKLVKLSDEPIINGDLKRRKMSNFSCHYDIDVRGVY